MEYDNQIAVKYCKSHNVLYIAYGEGNTGIEIQEI